MFGMTTVAGIQELSRVRFEGTRNAIVVAVSVSVGVLPMSFPALFAHVSGPARLIVDSGIFLGALTAIVLNVLLNRDSKTDEAAAEAAAEAHEAEETLQTAATSDAR
jgi:uric acid transporter